MNCIFSYAKLWFKQQSAYIGTSFGSLIYICNGCMILLQACLMLRSPASAQQFGASGRACDRQTQHLHVYVCICMYVCVYTHLYMCYMQHVCTDVQAYHHGPSFSFPGM